MALVPYVCKGCVPPKRHINCHATCPDYLEAKEKHEQELEMERKARRSRDDADTATFRLKRN